jgi:hypothetical protein
MVLSLELSSASTKTPRNLYYLLLDAVYLGYCENADSQSVYTRATKEENLYFVLLLMIMMSTMMLYCNVAVAQQYEIACRTFFACDR